MKIAYHYASPTTTLQMYKIYSNTGNQTYINLLIKAVIGFLATKISNTDDRPAA